ncbi:MAG: isochorismate synthase [Comamonas sp.]
MEFPLHSTDRQPEATQDAPAPGPDDLAGLLARYQDGDSLFISPGAALLGRGEVVPAGQDAQGTGSAASVAEAAQRLRARLAALQAAGAGADGNPDRVVMGAVPFDVRQPARLIRPHTVWRAAGAAQAAGLTDLAAPAPAVETAALQVEPQPQPQAYARAVEAALARFAPGVLDKVVLARTLQARLSAVPDARALLRRLAVLNRHGYTYAVPLGGDPAGAFLGATPELLVRRAGRRVIVNPLAGSAARGTGPAQDQAIAQALRQSPKDLHEHAVVIDAVAQALRPLCRTLDVPAAPSLVQTDALWHLSTTLEGELADPATTALDLALALHPTPAVCGHPGARAFEAIAELEDFDRGLFAGFVGWCDARGDGEWAVSLRCAELRGAEVRLYAGAGIVPGSVPQSEVDETQTKFRTMLRALGLAV